jgi:hypothetical protein
MKIFTQLVFFAAALMLLAGQPSFSQVPEKEKVVERLKAIRDLKKSTDMDLAA